MQVMTAEQFIVPVLSRWKPTAAVTVAAVYQSYIYDTRQLSCCKAEFAVTLCTSK